MKRICWKKYFMAVLACLVVWCGVTVQGKASTAGHTQAEAVNWATSQIGQSLDYDGNGPWCVDLIWYYYNYLGNSAYARGNAEAYRYNDLPPGWTRVYSNYQAGDIAVWTPGVNGTDERGHVGIITSADSVGFNAVNQRYANSLSCITKWFNNSVLQCAIRPDFSADPHLYGHADDIIGGEGEVYIRGWAFDGDVPAASASVHVYADGNVFLGYLTANTYRPDIVDGFQGINAYHGFEGKLKTSLTGEHKITVYVIDQANGDIHLPIGEKNVTISVVCTHNWDSGRVQRAATCTDDGEMIYTCTLCGDTKTETINASGHSWDSGKVTKAATCTTAGEKTYTCSKCNDTKTEIIEKTGHRYVTEVVAPTTHSKGYTVYQCSVCGDSYASDYVDPLPDTGNPGSQGTDPQEPEQPETGTDPQEPEQPETGTDPQEPEQPGTGTDPQEPEQPGTGTDPQEPEQPETGTDPEEPTQPETSTTPQTPTQPGTGATPQNTAPSQTPPASGTGQLLSGTILNNISGGNYCVTGARSVEFVKPAGKKSSVYIPSEIRVNGVTYQVTSIAANAFRNNRKLRNVTIGEGIQKIGANAFRGCKKLKSISIDTANLKKNRVGKNAFAEINKKVVFRISIIKISRGVMSRFSFRLKPVKLRRFHKNTAPHVYRGTVFSRFSQVQL